MLRRAPWILPFALFAAAVLIAGPWGNFPVNDDWQYARAAQRFAETGHFVIDTNVAPALFGQTLLAWPVIKLFGFSHLALRLLTFGLALLSLFAVDALLALGGAPTRARLWAGATLALSPLVFYLHTTFMTEVYGLAPVLVAAVLWLRGPRSWTTSLATGLLCAFGFWTRQYSVVALPALFLATLARTLFERRPLRTFVAEALPGALVCVLVVAAWFPWVKWTGNDRPDFAAPLAQLTRVQPRVWLIMIAVSSAYLTLFLSPLLAQLPIDTARWRRLLLMSAGLVGLGFFAKTLAEWVGSTAEGSRTYLHQGFPYLGNVLRNAGLGPMTFPEVWLVNQAPPLRWPREVWDAIASCTIALMALWSLLIARLSKLSGAALEVGLFGLFFAVFHLGLAVQAYQLEMYDRYLYPVVFGIALLTAVSIPEGARPPLRLLSPVFAALLAAFSILAVHDEFSWMAARWQLVERAHRDGVPPENLQAGYEADGWFHLDRFKESAAPRGCIGFCACVITGWYCQDDSYRIGMNGLTDSVPVTSLEPRTWLTAPVPITLFRRAKPLRLEDLPAPSTGAGRPPGAQ